MRYIYVKCHVLVCGIRVSWSRGTPESAEGSLVGRALLWPAQPCPGEALPAPGAGPYLAPGVVLGLSPRGKEPCDQADPLEPARSSEGMDVEGVTDFKALRAKFQNDPDLANKLKHPLKKPPVRIPPKLCSGEDAAFSPLPMSKRKVIILNPKDEVAHPVSQHKPLVRPRPRLGYVKPLGHDEEHEGNVSEKGLSSPEQGLEKPLPSYCTGQQGSAQTAPRESPLLPGSFHHALQIWEKTLSHGEKASAVLPTQRAANLYVQPCPEQRLTHAPAASSSSRMQLSGSKPMLDLPVQKKDALPSSGLALPQAPRGHRSSAGVAVESMVATAACQPGYGAPREQTQQQKGSEHPLCPPRAAKRTQSPRSKQPRIKPLPSAESLGPAPEKPARPQKLDLGAFHRAVPSVRRAPETTAAEEDYLTPESAQLEEQHNDGETPMYLNQCEDTRTLCVIGATLPAPKTEPEEHEKEKTSLFAKSSPGETIIEDEKEDKPSLEGEEQEAKETFKTDGNEYMAPTSQTKEDGSGEMKVPQVKQDVTSTQTPKHPTPQGLAKGTELLHLGAPKAESERTSLDRNTQQSLQEPENLYDDVGEIPDRLSHTSDASASVASASISGGSHEETYEDVEAVGDNPAKPEAEKQKRFGNLFKKRDKLRLRNIKIKGNLRLVSISVPNLASFSQEDMVVYDDVEMGQRHPREKDEKSRNWMPKFLTAKEDKDWRKSIENLERNIFKVKKSNAEKSKRMEKEERFFRETFMYDKEINVINTATAECSVPSNRRVDLPLTAGEQLEVIDVTEGTAVICRNSEGRYGYVLVEHLNFR
ncbi:FYN-binding protein 2 [Indicator indicator]|uniref:FYN-binding protein 2 n=1 Tax=Indicator indicator TaxID=1002788 RepID=UPI0023DFB760|nr:FYN-binding protein 2 [Indicator indicator]